MPRWYETAKDTPLFYITKNPLEFYYRNINRIISFEDSDLIEVLGNILDEDVDINKLPSLVQFKVFITNLQKKKN